MKSLQSRLAAFPIRAMPRFIGSVFQEKCVS